MSQEEEQARLRAELVGRFGERAFDQALELSGLRNCMQALATDCLTAEERAGAYARAGFHLAKLIDALVTEGESFPLTECAKRIDSAVEMWTLDDLEAREGLPRS